MLLNDLASSLRSACDTGALDATLTRHRAEFAALRDVPDTPALLARLDAAVRYSPERDALLADLLRLHRRDRDGAALAVLLCALYAAAAVHHLRLTAAGGGMQERVIEVLDVLVECIDAYDPDRHSAKVQASIELNVHQKLSRARKAEGHNRAALKTLTQVVELASEELEAGTYALADLLGPRETARVGANDNDVQEGAEEVLRKLAQASVLRPREVELIRRVDVRGERIDEVAQVLGLKLAAAKKALHRARRSLRKRRSKVEAFCVSPPANDVALPE